MSVMEPPEAIGEKNGVPVAPGALCDSLVLLHH